MDQRLPRRGRSVLKLALPMIASMGSQNLLNLVDVAMVGRLGTTEVAAVGLCGMVLWALTAPMHGFSPAVQAITARRIGEGDLTRSHESLINSFFLITLVGLPLTVLLVNLVPELFQLLSDDPQVRTQGMAYLTIRLYTLVIIGFNFCFRGYFNGVKRVSLYMYTLMAMHVVNILANYMLIFGKWGAPAMGIRGSALGTAIATTLGCLFFLGHFVRSKGFGFSRKTLSWTTIKGILRLGLPSCVQQVGMASGFLVFFRIAGHISTKALAAANILINLNLVCVLVAMGLGLATLTLVSDALGRNQPAEAVSWVKTSVSIACVSLGLLGLVLALFSRFWLGLFLTDPSVVALAYMPLVLLGLSQAFDSVGIVLSFAHLGGGASRRVMFISIANQWLFFLPLSFYLVYYQGGTLIHLWWCMFAYRFTQFLCYAVSIRQGQWLQIQV